MKRVRDCTKESSITLKKRKISNFKLISVKSTISDGGSDAKKVCQCRCSMSLLKERLERIQESSNAECAKLNALEREIKRMRRIISRRNKIAILDKN